MRSTKAADAPRRRRRSLAAGLTAWYAGSAFALLLLATSLLYWALAASLDREDDEFLADQVRILRVLLREHPGDLQSLRDEVQVESAARRHSRVLLRVLDGDRRSLMETPRMERVLPAPLFPEPIGVASDPNEGVVIRSTAGDSFRAVSAWASGPAGTGAFVLQVGVDRATDEVLLADFRRNLVLVLAAGLLVAAAVGYWIARRGVRPVAEIARTARRIGSPTLDRRIAVDGLPAELADLAATFNDMLARLEESFQRLSRFSADIAHELRTPIGNVRGEVEVALGKARSGDEYREVLGSALEECERLSRIIDSLLFLARAEGSAASLDRTRLELGAELGATREFFDAAAQEAGIDLRVDAPEPVFAELDRTLLQRALGNLVSNALAYTPRGGTVTLAARAEAAGVRIEVVDTGCGIPAEHLPHVFERFYRVDRSRSSASGGVGLGLAIVESIAQLHGGSAHIESTVGSGTRVTLHLPSTAPAAPPAAG